MTPKKKMQDSFQTFKLFGKQAQKLIDSAKMRMKTDKNGGDKQVLSNTDALDDEGILIHISIHSVVKATFTILAIALAVFIFYQIRDKLLILFLAVFLSVVIDPGVTFLERSKLPRGFAIFLVYIVVLAMILFLVISLIPIIAEQIQSMANRLTLTIDSFLANPTLVIPFIGADINNYINTLLHDVLVDIYTGGALQTLKQFGKDLSSAAQGSFHFVVGVAGSVVQFVVKLVFVLVMCFFIQLEKEKIIRWARVFLPYRLRRYFDSKAEAIHVKLGQWIRGQLMLSLSIGILVFIALKALGMQYALTLAVLAFFAEFVPVAGPIIAAIPTIFIAVAQSGFFPAMIVAIVYYGIQWCENNLLVPLIMQRAVGLSPIAVIFAMMVGISFPSTVHPVLGVLLAVPVATIISIFIQDYREWQGINDK